MKKSSQVSTEPKVEKKMNPMGNINAAKMN
jgi:hypothetical protein